MEKRVPITLLAVLLLPLGLPAGTVAGTVTAPPATDLATFVISIDDAPGPFAPPPRPVLIDQKGLRFIPHVLPILAGTTVEFLNSDPLAHNVFSISAAKRFNLGLYGAGTSRHITFDRPGIVQVLCNVHLEMSAVIVVLPNPYFARTAPDGSFRITGVPPGRHRIRCWHERLAAIEVEVDVPAAGTVNQNFHAR